MISCFIDTLLQKWWCYEKTVLVMLSIVFFSNEKSIQRHCNLSWLSDPTIRCFNIEIYSYKTIIIFFLCGYFQYYEISCHIVVTDFLFPDLYLWTQYKFCFVLYAINIYSLRHNDLLDSIWVDIGHFGLPSLVYKLIDLHSNF